MDKKIIFYISAIIVVLGVVFMGQQAYFRTLGANFISNISDKAGAYLSKGSSWASGWVTSNVYSRIGGEVQSSRGDQIQNEVNQVKENAEEKVAENITGKVQNYFSGISDSVLHPGENNCQSQTK